MFYDFGHQCQFQNVNSGKHFFLVCFKDFYTCLVGAVREEVPTERS